MDPKIAAIVSKTLEKQCIIVFDEAHNIDNVCIDALSVNLNTQLLDKSTKNLHSLQQQIIQMKQQNEKRLRAEYERLVTGLATEGVGYREDLLANPVLPQDILKESVPGNIRKGEHFIGFLRRLVEFLKQHINVYKVIQENPQTFLNSLKNATLIESKPLRFCAERLTSLMTTLEIKDAHEFKPLKVVADFATLVGTYNEGFVIIIEPYDERTPTIHDPVLQFR